MTVNVPLGGRSFTVDARWRLALAVEPVDALGGPAPVADLQVGEEVPPRVRPSRRVVRLDPLAARLDQPLGRSRGGTFTLLHRLDRPDPPGAIPVREIVIRLADPLRRCVPRRLRVPVWSLSRVTAVDTVPPVPPIPASARSIAPALFPGSRYTTPGGCTGVRGRLVQLGEPVRWARITALGPGDAVLGRAHGDERGEFLLLVTRTGSEPLLPRSFLTVRLVVWLPPRSPAGGTERDQIGDLVIEDAVRRDPGAGPGEIDTAVLRGERDPAAYVLSPDSPVLELTVGALIQPPPFTVT